MICLLLVIPLINRHRQPGQLRYIVPGKCHIVLIVHFQRTYNIVRGEAVDLLHAHAVIRFQQRKSILPQLVLVYAALPGIDCQGHYTIEPVADLDFIPDAVQPPIIKISLDLPAATLLLADNSPLVPVRVFLLGFFQTHARLLHDALDALLLSVAVRDILDQFIQRYPITHPVRQYFGLSIYDISAQDTTDLSDTCAQIALPAILIRLLDAVIRRGELSKNEHSQLCQLRSTLCERFVLSFKALDESDPLQTKYCLFFSLALSMLARDYRTGVAGTRDLIKCAGYAQQCINGEKKLNIPKADGYLQVALCLNARMEDMLNVTDTKMNGTLPFSSQLADAVREAVRDYHEGSMYKRDEAVRTFRRNLFPRWKPGLGNVLACCDIFQIILEAAYEKYVSAANQNNQNYQEIARLGYVSKAYLVLAAIGTSGGALNLLAQMLINQANQYEADQRISFFRRHPDIDTFVQQHAAPYGWPLNDNYALAYRVLQSVCGIQRGSQPYSHMKKAELVLKGYVSESSSTQLTSLNIAINGGLAMGHYWKGRLLLEQAKQDHDRCNDYKDAAIASFCATNVTERFDHLPENADEDAAPQLSPPQWLSAIELLRYPDRAVFRVDRRMVFQTIYQKLTQQVEEVQSDNIQIHNERYRLTKKDVRSNLERCLDMVKAQFPDKEPLIQKMIRSIR